MANEALTEDIVIARLREIGYFAPGAGIHVERQQSKVNAIKRLLNAASKTGGAGAGYPDFIITSDHRTDYVVIIECKANRLRHESPEHDRIADFAVDGILHYAKFLAREFNVIALAISGETSDELRISTYVQSRGTTVVAELRSPLGAVLDHLIPFSDLLAAAEFSPEIERLRESELMEFSRELHDFLWKYAQLTEEQKPLLVSGTLIALTDHSFANGFGDFTPARLQKRWGEVVKEQIEDADIPHSKKSNIYQPYSGIAVHPGLSAATKEFPKGVLHEVIRRIKAKVWPFIAVYRAHDVVGKFYGEFLKYTGGDKKALGIVLTPRHVTELFALLANVGPSDKVLDPCAGTGGFLISAMDRMLRLATTEQERITIRGENLIGIEQQPHMYALAASNMILRGDGKANLYQGSCFSEAYIEDIKLRHPTVGMINPPYAQGSTDLHELAFVDNMLGMLAEGAIGIAIVPVSCATSPNAYKEILMKKHTLEAVMSMPTELFYPVGVVTCIMVFTAKKPHASSDKNTWFGYWKTDGFEKTKNRGRIDLNEKWAGIRDSWVQGFRNREVVAGHSVTKAVTAQDEWIAEAYMETDYESLTADDFENVMRDYAMFQLLRDHTAITGEE